jgi:hypothetical protein
VVEAPAMIQQRHPARPILSAEPTDRTLLRQFFPDRRTFSNRAGFSFDATATSAGVTD